MSATESTSMTETAGFVVLYRWRLKAGAEEAFTAAWSKVTEYYREHHGSLGSRLHLGSDGFWYGYAQWPSAEAREEAFGEGAKAASGGENEAPWWEAMQAAVEESLPEVVLSTRADFLVLPRS